MSTRTDMPRRTYRQRRQARAARLRKWAETRQARAEQTAASTDALAAAIPRRDQGVQLRVPQGNR